ncbi:hypothetical protein EAG_03253 [Camponotus floridanus]|uniref:Uncharacterized protein n=1 Tax=Camponotus floridanus TaxID=104421 RepID=E2AFU1_CAMFO|nr:hypothetical protein EAG_03253 [Camponotus floridanus]
MWECGFCVLVHLVSHSRLTYLFLKAHLKAKHVREVRQFWKLCRDRGVRDANAVRELRSGTLESESPMWVVDVALPLPDAGSTGANCKESSEGLTPGHFRIIVIYDDRGSCGSYSVTKREQVSQAEFEGDNARQAVGIVVDAHPGLRPKRTSVGDPYLDARLSARELQVFRLLSKLPSRKPSRSSRSEDESSGAAKLGQATDVMKGHADSCRRLALYKSRVVWRSSDQSLTLFEYIKVAVSGDDTARPRALQRPLSRSNRAD